MDKKKIHLISRIESSDLQIFFGKKLTSKPFEEILLNNWEISNQAKGRIIFVLEEVEWASLAEVVLLSMWSISLRNSQKKVVVCLPFCGIISESDDSQENLNRRKAVCSFLSRWQFPKRLDEYGVEIYGTEQPYYSWTEKEDPNYCRVLPLRMFKREEDISNLKLDSLVYQILKEHSCLDPFESRAFSDIIFSEIASNIFEHASEDKKLPGIISIGMIKSNKWSNEEYGAWDLFYYKNLGENKSFLQIVIGDHGRGIYDTLFDVYRNDDHLNKNKYYRNGLKCLCEPFVIRYSLEKLSSCRTQQSRLRFSDIPRGLSWVYDIVREYNGFLSIRSGSTRMGISFLPSHNGRVEFDKESLADFGGTIIQIILPAYNPKELLTFHLPSEPFPGKQPNLHFLSIADYWIGREDTSINYDALLEELDRTIRPLDENDLVFIDFSGITWDKDTLTEFLMKIMFLQGDPLIIGINVKLSPSGLLLESEKVLLSEHSPIRKADIRIIPFIDIRGGTYFFCRKEKYERDLLLELSEIGATDLNMLESGFNSEKVARFIKKNRHIIRRVGDRLQIRPSLFSLPELLSGAWQKEIKGALDHPPENLTIMHSGSFHLSSGKYATKYLQLGHLFQIRNWTQKLSYALLTKIFLEIRPLNIDYIFGCTASASPLIESIAKGLSLDSDEDCLCIETYLDSLDHPDLGDIPESRHVLIVTDVISTGGLINRMAEAVILKNALPVAIVAIVDTREKYQAEIEVSGVKIAVYALHHEYIQKTNQPIKIDKNGQVSYTVEKDEIIEIDPLTASPSYYKRVIPSVIMESNEFFSKYIEKSYAIINRHVYTGIHHFCFFVDTKQIFSDEDIRSELVKKIVGSIKKDIGLKIPETLTILYPWGSNASEATPSLVSRIREELNIERISVRNIFRSRSKQGWRFGSPDRSYESIIKNKTVIIWDDGSNSGDTLAQLIDYASSFKPKSVLVYILISRFEPFYRKFFQNIKKYEGSRSIRITFVTCLDLPTYKRNNCPVCRKLDCIEMEMKQSFADLAPVRQHLNREKSRLEHIRLKRIRDEINNDKYLTMSELSESSESFRHEIANLISIREIVAKLESLIPTEDDRNLLRTEISSIDNLRMLARILRDEPEIWDKITRQCPDIADSIFYLCKDTLLGKYGTPTLFDLVTLELLFTKPNYDWLLRNMEVIILRLQNTEEVINSFIYHVIKFLSEDEIIEILKKCRDICETHRTNKTRLEGLTRVKIAQALYWASLSRSKNSGSEGSLREAIIVLEELYGRDPHSSAFEWWNKLMVTSLNAGFDTWTIRYKWWKEDLYELVDSFVKNLETLQPILSNMSDTKPYLLTASKPNYLEDLKNLDEKLHVLCWENADKMLRQSSYDEFHLIVNRLYKNIISKESYLSRFIKEFRTNLSEKIHYTLKSLHEELREKNIKINLTPAKIPTNVKIIFHKNLFIKVFNEYIYNITPVPTLI